MSYRLNQTPVSGEAFMRCSQIIIDNHIGRAPVVTFHREQVVGLSDGEVIRRPMSPRAVSFDPSAIIPILDPDTGEPTGQNATHSEVYALIYSVFIAAETAEPEEGAE